MNNKAVSLSLALAAFAAYMIYNLISSKEAAIKQKYGTPTAVVIAKEDIKEMGMIHKDRVTIVNKPQAFIDKNAFTTLQEVDGLIATVPISKGEQVTASKTALPGVKTGLSRQISPGKRAISINVNDENAVTRLIKPGDRIDITTTIDIPGAQKGNQVTKLLMQDVPVLAVGEYVTMQAPRKVSRDDVSDKTIVQNLNDSRNFNTITIEVDPQAALHLSYLRDMRMSLGVLLRNNDDSERVNLIGVNISDVLGNDLNRLRTPAAKQ